MSINSLGSYAVRHYLVDSSKNNLLKDSLESCALTLTVPSAHKSDSSNWRAKEIVRIKALYGLSTVPGALELYWTAFCLNLSKIIPELLPSEPPSCTKLWNVACSANLPPSAILITSSDVDSILLVLIQLTDGGCELSDFKSVVARPKESKKKRKQESPVVSLDGETISNALEKLNCLCEVTSFHQNVLT
jgi:hypothetical protein